MSDTLPPAFLVGFFDVQDFGPDVAEVPCTGNGPRDNAALMAAIRAKHPKQARCAACIRKTGSTIETRDPNEDPGYIDLDSGATLRQLFDAEDPSQPLRTSRLIGRAFFSGTPCNVVLTFNRSSGAVGVTLLPRIKIGDSVIKFGNAINPQQLVSELPRLVKEVLGHDARNIVLKVRESKPL